MNKGRDLLDRFYGLALFAKLGFKYDSQEAWDAVHGRRIVPVLSFKGI